MPDSWHHAPVDRWAIRIYTHARAGGALIIAAPAPFGCEDESVAYETECTRVRPLRKTYHGS